MATAAQQTPPQQRRSQQAATEPPEPAEENPSGEEAVAAMAGEKGRRPTDREVDSATEWFMSDEPPEGEADLEHTIELNVGGPDENTEHYVAWTVKPIDLDELRRIRRQATSSRAQRRAGGDGYDEVAANIKTVIAGTVDPDLIGAAREKGTNPEVLLRGKFRHKPGLLAQLSGQIMALSGYDDADVREVKAAGN